MIRHRDGANKAKHSHPQDVAQAGATGNETFHLSNNSYRN